MSNSKLLKEAIADAKAVRETAIANAKIALEEAFTPRLQSILSQKLQQEMEDEEDADVNEEYGAEDTSDADSSKIDGDNKQPADDANSSSELAQGNPDTEVETAPVGSEEDDTEVVKEGEEEGDDEESIEEGEYNADGEEEVVAEEEGEDESEEDEDELDLEAIIRELEEELDDEEEGEVEDIAQDVVDGHEEELHNEEESEEEHGEEEVEETYHEGEESEEDLDEEIDLNEILREMGYGDLEESEEEEAVEETVEENNELDEVKAELEAAMSTISELKSTINEVNLLNAKLLYTNKLFRSYELTNEQKMKVVETLDRTGNVREVKLVFSTLAESFKFTGTTKKQKQTKLTESFASKPVASTAPSKEVIQESTNTMADRFKKTCKH